MIARFLRIVVAAYTGATGVTNGAAINVAGLLMPSDVGPPSLVRLEHPTLAGDEEVGGHGCCRIDGVFRDTALSLWISRSTYALRRIQLRTEFPDFRVVSTTNMAPEFDGQVSDVMLTFAPPA
jgi:hypothetical protein